MFAAYGTVFQCISLYATLVTGNKDSSEWGRLERDISIVDIKDISIMKYLI
jgi:drug/metabolite transporter superfamily protein YnfA